MKTPEETCHHRSSGTGAKREVEGCGVPRLRLFYFGLYEHITVIIDACAMVFYSYMSVLLMIKWSISFYLDSILENQRVQRANQLFSWPCSIAMLNYQRFVHGSTPPQLDSRNIPRYYMG